MSHLVVRVSLTLSTARPPRRESPAEMAKKNQDGYAGDTYFAEIAADWFGGTHKLGAE